MAAVNVQPPSFPFEIPPRASTDYNEKPQQATEQTTEQATEQATTSSVIPESTTADLAGEFPVEMATPGADAVPEGPSETPTSETSSEEYQVFSTNPPDESITARNSTTVAGVSTRAHRFQLAFERAFHCEFAWRPFPELQRKIKYPPGWVEIDHVCTCGKSFPYPVQAASTTPPQQHADPGDHHRGHDLGTVPPPAILPQRHPDPYHGLGSDPESPQLEAPQCLFEACTTSDSPYEGEGCDYVILFSRSRL